MNMTLDSIRNLGDSEVVSVLDGLSRRQREIGAEIIAHLLIVKERGLHVSLGYSSLIEYCLGRLGCSRHVAYKWMAAVKVVEAHPQVLGWLAAGEITTSALTALAPHLADAELVARSRGKSRREIRIMCAAKHPTKAGSRIQFRVRPVADGLSRIEMTVSNALVAQIEEALELDSDLDATRDPVALLSRVLGTYIAGRKRKRQKASEPPRARPPTTGVQPSTAVPTHAAHEASQSPGTQCSYVSPEGRRCTARAFRGGDHLSADAHVVPSEEARIYCFSHKEHGEGRLLGKGRMRAARHRARLQRALAAMLKKLGFSTAVARSSADATVEALGSGAKLELLVKEAVERARGFRQASRARRPGPRNGRRIG